MQANRDAASWLPRSPFVTKSWYVRLLLSSRSCSPSSKVKFHLIWQTAQLSPLLCGGVRPLGVYALAADDTLDAAAEATLLDAAARLVRQHRARFISRADSRAESVGGGGGDSDALVLLVPLSVSRYTCEL